MAQEDQKKIYEQAIDAGVEELLDLRAEERRIAVRKAQIMDSLRALIPLVYERNVNIDTMTLSDAVRLVISSAGHALSPVEIKAKLQDLRFDLKKFDNPLASIHTAIKRMIESGELNYREGDKKQIIAGPELKQIAEGSSVVSLEEMLKSVGVEDRFK